MLRFSPIKYTLCVNAILLFSHGSVLCGAGENLKQLAREMEIQNAAPIVEAGFLNYSEPLLTQAFAKCVGRGATSVTIVPFFLVAGKFVQVDLPRAVEKVRPDFAQTEIFLADAMTDHPLLCDAILNRAQTALPPSAWREIWNTAPQFCQMNPQCPRFGSAECKVRSAELLQANESEIGDLQFAVSNSALRTSHSALVVLVHGSPRPESNDALFRVVEQVRARKVFDDVRVGFMECNAPSIPDAIAECVAAGAKSVVAVPYFLHAGNHVADDLPTHLEETQEKYPGVSFAMSDYLGRDAAILEVLKDRARDAKKYA